MNMEELQRKYYENLVNCKCFLVITRLEFLREKYPDLSIEEAREKEKVRNVMSEAYVKKHFEQNQQEFFDRVDRKWAEGD